MTIDIIERRRSQRQHQFSLSPPPPSTSSSTHANGSYDDDTSQTHFNRHQTTLEEQQDHHPHYYSRMRLRRSPLRPVKSHILFLLLVLSCRPFDWRTNTSRDGGSSFGGGIVVANAYRAHRGDDDYWNEIDDKPFRDDGGNWGYSGITFMPVSCVTYKNKDVIMYKIFDGNVEKQCSTKEIGVFVTSVAHYMRAAFNYLALLYGNEFILPYDAGYLNCVKLRQTASSEQPLYAKIGCRHNGIFQGPNLRLHLYMDDKCVYPYSDGHSARYHSKKGYIVDGETFSTKVTFRPFFHTCRYCAPEHVNGYLTKSNWYDDDVINSRAAKDDDDVGEEEEEDDIDDYFQDDEYDDYDDYYGDDKDDDDDDDDDDDANKKNDDDDDYFENDVALDDVYGGYRLSDDVYFQANDDDDYYRDDDDRNNNNNNNNKNDGGDDGDDAANDDDRRELRQLLQTRKISSEHAGGVRVFEAADGQLEVFQAQFARKIHIIRKHEQHKIQQQHQQQQQQNQRALSDVNNWNMCRQLSKYSKACHKDKCQPLANSIKTRYWTSSDTLIFTIMFVFMVALMALIFYEQYKAFDFKDSSFYDYLRHSNLPPAALFLIFFFLVEAIVALAKFRLVMAAMISCFCVCLGLFGYLLWLVSNPGGGLGGLRDFDVSRSAIYV